MRTRTLDLSVTSRVDGQEEERARSNTRRVVFCFSLITIAAWQLVDTLDQEAMVRVCP